MSATPTPRQLAMLGDALTHDGPCGLCGRQTAARDLGALAVEVQAEASRRALGLADGQGATLVLAVCRTCYPVAEGHPGEVAQVIASRLAAERQRKAAPWQ
ncbi:MAG TPA: hypothetical protein PLB88_08530 [Thermoanaerobaculaceae bacterium]|nr:hypothetical protein [Thermoanaerobaculaceae bacterium]